MSTSPSISSCYHCGEPCVDGVIIHDEKDFCCEGCKLVYQILDENELCTYYDLEEHPGISLKGKDQGARFAYLDTPGIAEKLIDFQDDQQIRVSFFLPQIHCSSCIWLLENLYRLRPEILESKVNFLKKELYLSFQKDAISLREVVELLSSIGYEPEFNLQDLSGKKGKRYNRRLMFQLGIAGFCFGNVMLLSFPEYLSLEGSMDEEFSRFFGYLNLFLALPVVFYSAVDYFRSAWYSLREGQLNIDVPISLGITVLFTRSAFEILTHSGAGYMDSLIGLVFFLLIGKWFQSKTYETLSFERDYESYFPVAVTRVVEDEEESVAVSDLRPGDHLVIRHQELIPCDALLMSDSAAIDYSFVTGEEAPVERKAQDQIYAGGRVSGPAVELQVQKAVSQSYLTRLWNHEAFEEDKASLTSLADRLGKYFTLTILVIAFIAGGYWLTIDLTTAVHVFTSVLIVACPCALALTTPFTLGNAMRIMGRHKLFLKNPQVIEQMANLDHLVFDKTGTLTSRQLNDQGLEGPELAPYQQQLLKSLARQSSHPISRAIAESLPVPVLEVAEVAEITGKGVQGIIDGHELKLGSSVFVKGKENGSPARPNGSGAWFAVDQEVLGHFAIPGHYRQALPELIPSLDQQYRLSLLSGDHDGERAALSPYFEDLYFDQSPHDKLAYIEELQQKGERVMMIGDGLNDAGALRKSQVGIALSENLNNFSPACDGILDAGSFALLDRFLEFAKSSLNLVKVGFVFSLLYNVIGLGFAIQGLLSPVVAAILMPLSSVSIIAFAVSSTSLLGKRIFPKKS